MELLSKVPLILTDSGVISVRIVPPLGRPYWSYLVIWASASCPVGRSAIWRVRSKGLVGSKRVCQMVGAVELITERN
jgi:hypothetical protein